jgi:Holliday junction resolvasome RuvABC endonuclease subunit
MIVLAFDVASVTGVAVGASGAKPRAWAVTLGRGGSEVDRLAKAITMTGAYIDKFKPDLVAVEAPVGGRDANALLIGLLACVKGEASRRGLRVVEYFPATIRKHFLGKALTSRDFPGKSKAASKAAIKGAVIARCHMLGWEVEGHDAGDAAALWDLACAMESRSHQMTSLPGMFQEAK